MEKTPPETLTVRIDRINRFALGVAESPYGPVRVPCTLPGEEVRIRLLTRKHGIWEAELSEVIHPSPLRVPAPCQHFARCGGCDLQQMDYDSQLKLKNEWVQSALHKIQVGMLSDISPSPSPFGYRNRITLHHDKKAWGFYRRHSHTLETVRHCPIASTALNHRLSQLCDNVLQGPESFELREDDATSFVQVNSAMNALLIQEVLRATAGNRRQRILELYAGAGNFTFALAAQCREIIALEGNADAVNQAELRLKNLQQAKISFVQREILAGVHEWIEQAERFDTIVCDPPRGGLGAVAALLPRLGATRIVHISCDLDAFVRDAHNLIHQGFSLRTVTPLDMFPQTRHMEIVGEFVLC